MISSLTILALCADSVYVVALLLNVMRKNRTLIALYVAQSLAVASALAVLSGAEHSSGLLYAALLTLAVKCVMAPLFLLRLVKRYTAHFSAASYLSLPLTLLALAFITGFSFALSPRLGGTESASAAILIAAIFSAFFLMVNRRGALATVVGVLALENGVVLLAATLGAAHSFALEFTVAFDIAVWILIATAFITMMHRQFGIADADTRAMSRLTED